MKYLTRSIFVFILIVVSAISFGQSIKELQTNIAEAQLGNDTLAMAREWYKLGVFYDKQQEVQQSNRSFLHALYWANSIKSSKAIASISNYLASNYSIGGQSDSAIYYYQMALKAGVEYGDSTRIPVVLMNLGDSYADIGEYVKAANYAISAIRIKEQIGDSDNLAYYYQKVGEVYKNAGEKEKWEEYVKKAYRFISNKEYTSVQADAAIYNDLGGIAELHKNYDQALLYYDTLSAIGAANNYPHAIGIALANSATIYKERGELDKALKSALEARKFKTGSGYQEIYDYNLLAELFLAKGDHREALKYALLTYNNKAVNNNPEEKMRAFKILYLIEKSKHNFEKALLWNERFKELSDSIRNKEIRSKILDLEIAYQTEKKEQQIELLTTENELKTQRINAGIGIVTVLVVVILLIVYILNIRKKQAVLLQNNLQHQILRVQMNPHFIFNALGSIQNFMYKNETRKAAGYLGNFASLTRAILEHSTEEFVSLSAEIETLHDYVKLEQMRVRNSFEYKIEYNDDLDTEFINVPPMLIQPFVENAIKHGLKNLDYPGYLHIQFTENNNQLEIKVTDNGYGINAKKTNDKKNNIHRSMSMQIFKERCEIFTHRYKKEIGFKLIDRSKQNENESGTEVLIIIPV